MLMKTHYNQILFLFIFCLLVTQNLFAGNGNLSATFYSADEGLSSTKLTGITQDSKGFIWIGTEDGLNKFDGYTFTIYKNKKNDSLSLLSDNISTLYTDSENRLWVATIEGLQYYNDSIDGFIRTGLNQPDYIIRNNQCLDIKEDSKGNLWFVSSSLGVLRYTRETDESIVYTPSHTNPEGTLCSKYIRTIEEDQEGNIWFGSADNGISVFDPKTETFRNYNKENSALPSNSVFDLNIRSNGDMLIATINGGVILFDSTAKQFITYQDSFNSLQMRSTFCVKEDSHGNLLVGSEGNGLVIFNPEQRNTEQHPVFKEYSQNIGDSKVHCIYEDNNGNLWIGMNFKGLCLIRTNSIGFNNFIKSGNQQNSLSYGHVMGIATDKGNNIWIATDGGGLNFYDRSTGKFKYYKCDDNNPHSISDNAVVSVFCDSKDRIWAGTYIGGLCLLDRETDKFTRFQANGEPGDLQSNFVKSINEDKKGNIWVGTNGGGLYKLNEQTGKFKAFRNNDYQGLINDHIAQLTIDSKGRLWIGTFFGLCCMDIDTETFASFGVGSGLSNLSVYSIAEDEKGTIWVGTQNGLNKYNSEKNLFESIYPRSPELSPVINGIIPVGNQLWLSTNSGIINYSPLTYEYKEYKVHDGLQSNEFILASYFKSPKGELFFGGVEGFNSFFPQDIENKHITPTVYITDLKIANKSVKINEPVNGRVILDRNISMTDKIKLKYDDKTFTLEFTAPDAPIPSSILYSFKLEGFDKDWINIDHTRRYVTYTNLDPGTYTFRVKASNHREMWNNTDTALTITIMPPFWATWWARLFYVIFAIALVYLILRFVYIRIREKNELRIERLRAKQKDELNEAKMHFFTNISHEFRTPLTLIMGPLERMINEEKDAEKGQILNLMHRNAERLLKLINQILELHKLEQGQIKLHVEEIEAVSFISGVVGSFTELSERKKISLTYDWNPNKIHIWYDADMLEKCLYNILSNAFKFTKENGKIHVNICQEENTIYLSVSDTGIGMNEETKQHIFDRFFQGSSDTSTKGSGIGMHFTKSIIEQHKGTIKVDSREGEGSTITISILPGKEHFSKEEIKNTSATQEITVHEESVKTEQEAYPLSLPKMMNILLVEDDEDMRSYIISELKGQYNIETAVNGKQGLAKALKMIPDLIITDVMMPEMNGYELCSHIKNNPSTSHIPVIILTAQGEIEHRIEGLESGADSYIPKPFNTQHLKTRIEKLIELRRNMKERFSKSLNMEAQEVTLTGTDERLLQQVIDYIRKHIENPELSVEGMSRELGISRTHLHRKLKALTGQSPVDFIRTIRMKQAAYLLSTGKLTISEVGYKVGYNTPSYFSSCFSTHFGVSPTQYMEKSQEKGVTKT